MSNLKMKPLKSFDELFQVGQSDPPSNQAINDGPNLYPIERIRPFDWSKFNESDPFASYDEQRMKNLTESIRINGVIEPVVLRPTPPGDYYDYELISGMHRCIGSELAGLDSVPGIVRYVDDDTAMLLFVDSNLARRPDLSLRELSHAYAIRLQILSRQGQRTSRHGDEKLSVECVAAESGRSATEIHAIARLQNLIPELMDAADAKKMQMRSASEIAKLTKDQQKIVYGVLTEHGKINMPVRTAEAIRKMGNELTAERVSALILPQVKSNEPCYKNWKPSYKMLSRWFPATATPLEVDRTISRALDEHFARLRQREDQEMEM